MVLQSKMTLLTIVQMLRTGQEHLCLRPLMLRNQVPYHVTKNGSVKV